MEAKKYTVAEALSVVETISNYRYDPEVAHGQEDSSRENFIQGLAIGLYTYEEAIEIAGILIRSSTIPFERHCA